MNGRTIAGLIEPGTFQAIVAIACWNCDRVDQLPASLNANLVLAFSPQTVRRLAKDAGWVNGRGDVHREIWTCPDCVERKAQAKRDDARAQLEAWRARRRAVAS